MNATHEDKSRPAKSRAAAQRYSKRKGDTEEPADGGIHREYQDLANNSPRAIQLKSIQAAANRYTQSQSMPIPTGMAQPGGENRTGLPDNLKAGIEHLSGFSMSDVKVHYNSSKPSTLQAHAYAQGTQIHVAPGQERHLPHEAWHVVQQKQGRVRPTVQLKELEINDDQGLEKEADRMGLLALRTPPASAAPPLPFGSGGGPTQRKVIQRFGEELGWYEATVGIIAIAGLETIRRLYQWRPNNRSKADMLRIARAIGLMRLSLVGDSIALAQMPWQMVNVLQLAANINTNANGLTVAQWIAIATALGAESPADATAFAQIPGWGAAAIVTLVQNRVNNNAGGHTAANWAAIATGIANVDDHAAATTLARLPGWNFADINTLVQNRIANNPNNLTAAQWAALAAPSNANDHAGTSALARMTGWNFAAIQTLAQNRQAANPRAFSTLQWAAIGEQAGANTHAQTDSLATMPAWAHNHIVTLATEFRTNNPANRAVATWIAVASLSVDAPVTVREFARLPVGWTDNSVIGLAGLFAQNANARSPLAWHNIAVAHATLHNQRLTVALFARMPGGVWSNASLVTLATHFATNANTHTANQWSDIAGAGPALANQPDRVRDFARMPHWNFQNTLLLATAFATNNPQNFTTAEWIAIANDASNNLRNQPADVISFARMGHWNHGNIMLLAASFGLYNPRHFTAAEWVAIGTAYNGLYNNTNNTTRFAVMANWNHGNIVALAQAFGAGNARGFTVAQWILIANDGAPLYNQEAAVAHFARMPNWAHAHIRTLAQHYCANANGRSADDWTLIANMHAGLLDLPDTARDFALLSNAITRAELITMAVHLLGTLNAQQTRALINALHPAITGARLAVLIPAVNAVNNLVAAAAGAHAGASFAATATLLMNGAWTPANIATVVQEMTTPGNAPGANTLVHLLHLANAHAILTPANLITVLQNENPGQAADWATACTEFVEFINAGHVQPVGLLFGMGGAVVSTATYNSVGATNIQVQVQYLQQRLNHFEAGHTYNRFLFSFANTHRAGSPYSFWNPAGATVRQRADVVVNNGLLPEATASVRNNAFTQRIHAGYEAGFQPQGVAFPLVAGQVYTTEITQFYPLGPNLFRRVSSDVVHLVGRLRGHY